MHRVHPKRVECMRRAFCSVVVLLLLAGCARVMDVIAYETSIAHMTVSSSQVPLYDTQPVDATLAGQLQRADFTAFLHLDRHANVFEWYRPGFSRTRPVNVKSVSKSLFSTLVGQTGLPLEVPITSFAECAVPPDLAPLTMAHLLNMTAGFRFTENETIGVYAAPAWGCSAMALPVDAPSGERFNYSTLQYHLAGLHFSEVTEQDIAGLMQSAIFTPMGVTLDGWVVSPDGDLFTGSEIRLQPRDMLRFGHVMVQNGRWNGQQIIPSDWVLQTRRPVRQDTGRPGITYGWGWWQTRLAGQFVQFAEGYGGQAIVIAPETQQVFVFTAPTGGLVSGKRHDQRVDALLSFVAQQLGQ